MNVDTEVVVHSSQFMISKILAEKSFDIPLDGRVRKVIGMAVYIENGNGPNSGTYCLKFTVEGQLVPTVQPDKMHYSREQAKQAAEFAFSSGEVRALVEKKTREWIFLYLKEG
jgi:lipoate-protein ligase A